MPSLDNIKYYRINDQNPVTNKAEKKLNFTEVYNKDISNQRNKEIVTYRENDKGLADFYTSYDPFKATTKEIKKYEKFKEDLNDDEKEILKQNQHFYELKFSNIGGLVMPIILDFTSSAFLAVPSGFFACGATGKPFLSFFSLACACTGFATDAILALAVAVALADSVISLIFI